MQWTGTLNNVTLGKRTYNILMTMGVLKIFDKNYPGKIILRKYQEDKMENEDSLLKTLSTRGWGGAFCLKPTDVISNWKQPTHLS